MKIRPVIQMFIVVLQIYPDMHTTPKPERSKGNRKYAQDALFNASAEGIVDAELSLSSCPSSSDEESTDKPPSRLKYTLPRISDEPFSQGITIIQHKSNKDKSLIILPKFLSESRIMKMRRMFHSSKSCFQINDRKDDLYHSHVAYRVEVALRLEMSKIYKKIMDTTVRLVDSVWGDIRDMARRNRVIPEIEYIVYDVEARTGDKGVFIEPHVDNHSICTGVAMLSVPDVDFTGGVNRFKGPSPDNPQCSFREYKLSQGDLVLFRGEVVTHWITPVTDGRREILQWELSRI